MDHSRQQNAILAADCRFARPTASSVRPGTGAGDFAFFFDTAMPTAAVIIAAKDAAAWLPECLASVMGQRTPPGWEVGVILGIDACPMTLAIASRINRPRLATRFFPEHVGPYIIFNSLAYFDRSDVLVRFDADDIMLQGYLQAQLRLLNSSLAPMIIQTWSTYVDAELRSCVAPLADGTFTSPDGRRSHPSDGQFLMTRSAFSRLRSFRGWSCHADSEFILRARWSGVTFKTVREYLYLRRVHSDSLTTSRRSGYGSSLRRKLPRMSRRRAGATPGEKFPNVFCL